MIINKIDILRKFLNKENTEYEQTHYGLLALIGDLVEESGWSTKREYLEVLKDIVPVLDIDEEIEATKYLTN